MNFPITYNKSKISLSNPQEMAGTSRNLSTADELDSTILRHQVKTKYFKVNQFNP